MVVEDSTAHATRGAPAGALHDFAGTFWAGISRAATRYSDLLCASDTYGRRLTFQQLREESLCVADGLVSLGVKEGTRVSWQLPTGLEALVLMCALSRVGAVQNPLITSLRAAELATIAEQFAPEFVFTCTEFRGFDHRGLIEEAFGERARVVVAGRPDASAGSGRVPLGLPRGNAASLTPAPTGDEVRWIFTTSGSTAAPKCVRHTDQSLWSGSNAMAETLPIGPDDMHPIAYPLSHIGGAAFLAVSLRTGCAVQLIDVFDPVRSPLDMAAAGGSLLGSATPFFDAYVSAQRAHGGGRLFDRLKFCIGGGAPVAPDLDIRVQNELGGLGILNGYGLTECPSAGFPPARDREAFRSSSAWLPAPGVEVRIVGSDGRDLEPGHEGELRLIGPQLFAGYLDRALDADAFDDKGFLRTGDLAVVGANGGVAITGRIKEIVIRKGENISLPEVEAALGRHPAIADVAVAGIPDPRTGERCCAVIKVAEGHAAPDLADLAACCAAAGLARFKTPEQIAFVDTIPRTAMGKIARAELRAWVLTSQSARADRTPA